MNESNPLLKCLNPSTSLGVILKLGKAKKVHLTFRKISSLAKILFPKLQNVQLRMVMMLNYGRIYRWCGNGSLMNLAPNTSTDTTKVSSIITNSGGWALSFSSLVSRIPCDGSPMDQVNFMLEVAIISLSSKRGCQTLWGQLSSSLNFCEGQSI